MYILFEGVDTCGKTTQISLIKERYPEIITTKEPGGTPFGKKAREMLLEGRIHSKRAELLLFLADRSEHYEEIIKPNIHRLIISDRGFISGLGYALANGEFDLDTLMKLNRFALEENMPDKVVLFLTNEETILSRSKSKKLDGIEMRGVHYLLRVQEMMKESILKLGIPHIFIDATDDIETIHETLTHYIRNNL